MKIMHRVSAAWGNGKKSCGVLCDRKLPVKLNAKIHRKVVGQQCCFWYVAQRHGEQ